MINLYVPDSPSNYEHTDHDDDHLVIQASSGWVVVNNEAVLVPEVERQAAAQALAGDEWQVVPKAGALPPLYLLDDLWQALGGDPHDFDDWHTRHGAANTWGQLLAIVRRAFRPVCGKPVDGEYCVLTAPRSEEGMHICHGPSDVGIDELPPIPAAQPDRPEPVDPASVRAGDIVDYETTVEYRLCRIMGEVEDVAEHVTDGGTSLKIHDKWWNCTIATVRILQRPEPVPDEADVEALAEVVHIALATVGPPREDYDWRKWSGRIANLLAGKGYVVSTDA